MSSPGGPQLRSVREGEPAQAQTEAGAGSRRTDTPRWIPILLAVLLAIALTLLVWSRLQLGERIASLQSQITALRSAVAERDLLIGAQDERLHDVRQRVQELHSLLDEPLQGAD